MCSVHFYVHVVLYINVGQQHCNIRLGIVCAELCRRFTLFRVIYTRTNVNMKIICWRGYIKKILVELSQHRYTKIMLFTDAIMVMMMMIFETLYY